MKTQWDTSTKLELHGPYRGNWKKKKTPESFAPGILETSLLVQKLANGKSWLVRFGETDSENRLSQGDIFLILIANEGEVYSPDRTSFLKQMLRGFRSSWKLRKASEETDRTESNQLSINATQKNIASAISLLLEEAVSNTPENTATSYASVSSTLSFMSPVKLFFKKSCSQSV